MNLFETFTKAKRQQIVAAAFLVSAGGATALAQEATIDFNGNRLNCATLQGKQDTIPGSMTCAFVEEVEQYFEGPMLSCPQSANSYDPQAMQLAARHLADSHGQPALRGHAETESARVIERATNARTPESEHVHYIDILRDVYGSRASGFHAIHFAVEGTRQIMGIGESFEASTVILANIMNQEAQRHQNPESGMNPEDFILPGLPEGSTNTPDAIDELFDNNPVIDAYVRCRVEHPDITWDHFQR